MSETALTTSPSAPEPAPPERGPRKRASAGRQEASPLPPRARAGSPDAMPRADERVARIVVVSNRLPIVVEAGEGGGPQVRGGSGGLVTALGPILRRCGGLWIGWPGPVEVDSADLNRLVADQQAAQGFELRGVPLTAPEQRDFYQGFCNEIIWPLFHDLQTQCNFLPQYWESYLTVKQKFADAVMAELRQGDFIWVHDYHLMGLARELRARNVRGKIGYFLHVPFPPPDIYCKLPWRRQILKSLLLYDVVGFQTPHDLENFGDCVRKLIPQARRRRRMGALEIGYNGRPCTAGAFPIGIDFDEFAGPAATPDVAERARQLRADMQDQQVLLGLDRLDYTKGIPYRLRAFQLALRRFPELHRRVTLLQVVIPSRESVPTYQDLKAQIEQLVSQVNGEFTQPGWVPIHHVFRSLDRHDLLAYYRMADAALITPLKDGMNLVSKEYVACQVDGNGVLILSEFAGAATQFGAHAILVNPYDMETLAEQIRRAVLMSRAERRPAMGRMRSIVRRQDVYWWSNRFLSACGLESLELRRERPAAAAATVPASSGEPGA